MKVSKDDNVVTLADKARDAGRWEEAADLYSQHLQTEKTDFPIWIQRGNCLKEAKLYEEALSAYNTALTLNAADDDLFLQRGHLFKLMNRMPEAAQSYEAAINISPGNKDAFKELISLESAILGVRAGQPRAGEVIYYDVTDLLIYLREHPAVSGIQRVISKFIDRCVTLEQSDRSFVNIRFVVLLGGEARLVAINPRLVLGMLDLIRDSSASRDFVLAAIDKCYSTATAVDARRGDTYVILGAFWISPTYERLLIELRENGVAVGILIYDLLPITHREYFDGNVAHNFARGVTDVLLLCDFVMTISEHVAGEARALLKKVGHEIPVRPVPLAHELDDTADNGQALRDEVKEAAYDDFVLCVGTLEIRKNHAYLLRVWQGLIAERGADRVPNLVFIGRWGWKMDSVRQSLEETNYLNGKVHILYTISDPELKYLYGRCLFTTFPSLGEGWGLPVGESLMYGKPCLASNSTSIPEVGGDLVRYIDPLDVSAGLKAFAAWLDDPQEVQRVAKQIEADFKPRRWIDVTRNLQQTAAELSKQSSRSSTAHARARPGEVVHIGAERTAKAARLGNLQARSASLVRISGWWPIEDWGGWSRSKIASLRFQTDAAPHSEVTIALHLKAIADGIALAVTCGDRRTGPFDLRPSLHWYFVKAKVDERQIVELQLRATGGPQIAEAQDQRRSVIGMDAFGYYETSDLSQKLDLLQSIIAD